LEGFFIFVIMNIILFDDSRRNHLLPLTYTRPVADLRIGILTIKEKWEKHAMGSVSFLSQEYLKTKFQTRRFAENWLIAGSIIPEGNFIKAIRELTKGQALIQHGELLAACDSENSLSIEPARYNCIEYTLPLFRINHLWDIFSLNARALEEDFELITSGRKSAEIDPSNTIIGNRFFAEEGATALCSVFNTTSGPIYLGKNTEVWEGSLIRGAFALCEESAVKLGAKIYGATTVGPHSRVGGEINNSVIQGYSNKGHDGFLGNSVLGEWCNLGADTNNSNLKNNYADVKLWNYAEERMVSTGLQFCGLIMGDHSKCGINTMFNTGTVVGVSANIFGAGFPKNHIPSFSWGGAQGITEYNFEKAAETATLVMERRHKTFDQIESQILAEVFELTRPFRQS
jgi:UDP-N-acetylglucosamine diphosphorylase/glucosamine-1-phosphate N-acetyltransferase